MFIHWGPVSLTGREIGWSRGGERRGRKGRGPTPVEVYDNLYKRFNPVRFDADEWVRIARDAGMRYLVFTTKHHDGFVNFDSKLTDYKITSPESPFRRDVVAELARACHEGGLRLGFYYSQPDWHHPDYRAERHARYVAYLHGQLRELCTNYGRVDIIWFDGLGGSAADWDAERLFKMIRELQPRIIINNRCGVRGDFDTPEQRVGAFDRDRPWETCMTICRQWAWKPNDRMKSVRECVRTLVRVAGGDGNFLLNVGPMPDGRIEPRQVERLLEMGRWLRSYGHTIYGTRGGPFKPGRWGASTCRGESVYLHVFEWPEGGFVLPATDQEVLRVRLVGRGAAGAEAGKDADRAPGPRRARVAGGGITLETTPEGLRIAVPPRSRRGIDTVVELTLDGPAEAIPPVSVPAARSGSLAFGKKAAASNIYRNMREYGAGKAFDDDPGTRGATDAGTRSAWLEVDLGERRTLARAVVREAYSGRVRSFELRRRAEGEWRTFHRGTTLGDPQAEGARAEITFAPVTARRVRLVILEATEGPTIWELQLFGPGAGGE
jgi:alpha-L-fucosidase